MHVGTKVVSNELTIQAKRGSVTLQPSAITYC